MTGQAKGHSKHSKRGNQHARVCTEALTSKPRNYNSRALSIVFCGFQPSTTHHENYIGCGEKILNWIKVDPSEQDLASVSMASKDLDAMMGHMIKQTFLKGTGIKASNRMKKLQ
uniref:Uncharacterized protein n=1 Tax=Coccidioides posadasii RMSCC 3488 TaxID=454284 RepID=A0A0J6FLT0_COCPO|nr:hypothetical protein CPAG_07625 [Coccidioides posadasii RMSCC 3488]